LVVPGSRNSVSPHDRNGAWNALSIVAVCLAAVTGITASVWAWQAVDSESPINVGSDVTDEHASATDNPDSRQSVDSQTRTNRFPVTIRKPAGPPRVATGATDSQGNAVTVGCSTCHSTRKPNTKNKTTAGLNEFHIGMKFSHGKVSCLSCHNSDDYDALKLADGRRVEFVDVMTLCAQCHGTQTKDYNHGAHGGMNGFWDTTRGPRTRNNCVDCHHPHAPQFPKMQPTFKPKDRFLDDQKKAAH